MIDKAALPLGQWDKKSPNDLHMCMHIGDSFYIVAKSKPFDPATEKPVLEPLEDTDIERLNAFISTHYRTYYPGVA